MLNKIFIVLTFNIIIWLLLLLLIIIMIILYYYYYYLVDDHEYVSPIVSSLGLRLQR